MGSLKKTDLAEVQVVSVEDPLAHPEAAFANYRQLVARAVEVFGDEMKASRWLSVANVDLEGETPLQFARRCGYSAESLEPVFTRIEHGIYT